MTFDELLALSRRLAMFLNGVAKFEETVISCDLCLRARTTSIHLIRQL